MLVSVECCGRSMLRALEAIEVDCSGLCVRQMQPPCRYSAELTRFAADHFICRSRQRREPCLNIGRNTTERPSSHRLCDSSGNRYRCDAEKHLWQKAVKRLRKMCSRGDPWRG
jgi:hypothetical protein